MAKVQSSVDDGSMMDRLIDGLDEVKMKQ